MFDYLLREIVKDPIGYGIAFICLVLAIIEFFHGLGTKRELELARKLLTDEGKTSREENRVLVEKLQKQTEQLQRQEEQLQKQQKNVAVAYFPDNLPELTKFILETKKNIWIMVDSLGYAIYSNPVQFESYLAAIQTILDKGCEVRLLLYSADTLRKVVARQFPPGHKGEDFEKTEKKSKRFRTFFEGKTEPKSFEEFRDILLEKEQDLFATVPKATVKIADRPFSAFCRIRDDASLAMFAFRNDGVIGGGLTFQTVDLEMRRDFKAIFDAEWDEAANPVYRGRW